MNEDFGTNNSNDNSPLDAELQVRLMNLVMGEASDFESDQLQLLMEQRPEVAAYYQHLLHLHGLLSEVGTGELLTDAEDDTPNDKWQLSADRRKQVLAVLNGEAVNPQSNPVAPKPEAKTRWFFSSRWIATGLAAAACLLVALMLPSRQMARIAARRPKIAAGTTETFSVAPTTLDFVEPGLAKQPPTVFFAEQDKPETIQLGAIAVHDARAPFLNGVAEGDAPSPTTGRGAEVAGKDAARSHFGFQKNDTKKEGTGKSGALGLDYETEQDVLGDLYGTAEARVTALGSTSVVGKSDQLDLPSIGQSKPVDDFLRDQGQQGSSAEDRFSSNTPADGSGRLHWDVQKGYALTTPGAVPQSQPAKREEANFGDRSRFDANEQQLLQLVEAYNDAVDKGGVLEAESIAKRVAEIDSNSEVAGIMAQQQNSLRERALTTLSQEDGSFVDGMLSVDEARIPSSRVQVLQEYEKAGGGRQSAQSKFGANGNANGRGDESKIAQTPQFAADLDLEFSQGDFGRAVPPSGGFDANTPRLMLEEEEVLQLEKKKAAALPDPVGGKESTDLKLRTDITLGRVEQTEESLKEVAEAGDAVAELSQNSASNSQFFRHIAPASPEAIAGAPIRESESKPREYRGRTNAARGLESIEGKDPKKLSDNVIVGESDAKRGESRSLRKRLSQGQNSANSSEWFKDQSVSAAEPEREALTRGYYLMDDVQRFGVPSSAPSGKKQAIASLEEQATAANAFSTFSLHVSDVSFKLAQAALNQNQMPEASKIRIEEFVNAIDYHDPLPTNEEKVACRIEQAIHPFLMQRNMLRISMRTAASGRAQNTPLRLTLLLDNSGSMERPDRRQAVYRAFKTLTQQLNAADQVTLISFASTPRLLADKVPGNQGDQLLKLIETLPSEGGTNIEAALQLAREKAAEQQTSGAQNRIVLMTDGAVNLGNANPAALSKMVTQMRDAGIAFDAAGIGTHDLNDEVLEALTRQGDGRYYLIDATESASDGFAAQIAGALRPSAKNVKVQVEFNPQRVTRYKLLGFEKHKLKQEDFRNDRVDAAEMAAAEAGVAMYQFEANPNGSGDVGYVSVRFGDLATGNMVERRWPIPYEPSAPRLEQASPTMQLAAAASLFAAKLIGGPLADSVDLAELNSVLATLPEPFANQARVQQLKTMIEQVRKM